MPTQSLLSLNGTSQYVDFETVLNFNGKDFSLEAWVFIEKPSGINRILSSERTNIGKNQFALIQNKDTVAFMMRGATGGSSLWSGKDHFLKAKIPVKRWTHVAVTRKGTRHQLFINGKLSVEHKTQSKITYQGNKVKLRVGAQHAQSGNGALQFFGGKVADVRVWSVALTEEKIKERMRYCLKGNESGLMAYWPLNDGKGKTVASPTRKAKGTVHGAVWKKEDVNFLLPPVAEEPAPAPASAKKTAPTPSAPADSGHPVLSFDGQNDKIDCGDKIDLANTSFTIEFWAKRRAMNQWDCVVFQGKRAQSAGLHIGFRETNYFTLDFYGDGLDVDPKYTDTDWHHWSCVYDHDKRQKIVYRDGVKVGQRERSPFQGKGSFYVGTFVEAGGGLSCQFGGELADLRIWKCVRSPQAIKDTMKTRLSGQEEHLVAYWPMDEGGGSVIKDRTGHTPDISITGPTWGTQADLLLPYTPENEPSQSVPILTFNGDSQVTFDKVPSLTTAVTIEFWAKGANSLAEQTVFLWAITAKEQRVVSVHLPWKYISDTRVFWDAGNDDGFDRIDKAVVLEDYNEWTHWAFVKDVATESMRICRNGELWHQGTGHTRSLADIKTFFLGAHHSNTRSWKGSIADFRIWDVALDCQDVRKRMYDRLTGNEPGLVVYWPFDEGGGTTVGDKTGNGCSGTVSNATWDTAMEPTPQSVLMFNGTSDYISVPDSPSLRISDYTVEVWLKTSGTPNEDWKAVVGKPGRNYNIWLHKAGFVHHRFHVPSNGNAGAPDTAHGSVPWDQWVHVAITNDGTTAKTYINGELKAEGPTGGKLAIDHTPLYVARRLDGEASNYFKGQMADIRVWDRVRSPQDITSQMGQRLTGTEEGLVGYWPLDEGEGATVAVDKTGNGNDGTIHGGTWSDEELDVLTPLPKAEVTPSESASSANAMSFDGSNAYVEVPYQAAHNPKTFTISCWAKVTGGEGQWRSPITSRKGPPQQGYNFYAGTNNKWQFWIGDGNQWVAIHGADVVLNQWVHLTGTYDGKEMRLYVDGQLAGDPKAATLMQNQEGPLRIGAGKSSDVGYHFPGQLSEVRLWDHARSPADIQADMPRRMAGNEAGLIGYWPLDGRDSAVADNLANPDCPGTIHDATAVVADDLELEKAPSTPVDEPDTSDQAGATDNAAAADGDTSTDAGTDQLTPASSSQDNEKAAITQPNSALALANTNSPSDYVIVNPFKCPTHALTVEFWIKVNPDGRDHGTPLGISTPSQSNEFIIYGCKNIAIYVHGSAQASSAAFEKDQWQHFAASWESQTGQAYLYIDGESVHSTSLAKGAVLDSNGILVLGQEQDSYGGSFDTNQALQGQMAEVRVWDHVRTPDEIKSLMNQRCTGKEDGLIGYWPLDGKDSAVADNLANPDCPGIINGATTVVADDLELEKAPSTPVDESDPSDQDGATDDATATDGDTSTDAGADTSDQDGATDDAATTDGEDTATDTGSDDTSDQDGATDDDAATTDGDTSTDAGADTSDQAGATDDAATDGDTSTDAGADTAGQDGATDDVAATDGDTSTDTGADTAGQDGATDDVAATDGDTSTDTGADTSGQDGATDDAAATDGEDAVTDAESDTSDQSGAMDGDTATDAESDTSGQSDAAATGDSTDGDTSDATSGGTLANVLQFDGKDDYVDIPPDPSLDVTDGYTIEAWIKPAALGGRLVDKGIGGQSEGFTLDTYPQNLRFINKGTSLSSPEPLAIGTWQHVAVIFENSADGAKLLIDGEVVQTATPSQIGSITDLPVRLGSQADALRSLYTGEMAEVRIWNVPRSPEEIKQARYHHLKKDEPGLAGYWPLNEGGGAIATDQSSQDNPGTINGASWQESDLPLVPAPEAPGEAADVEPTAPKVETKTSEPKSSKGSSSKGKSLGPVVYRKIDGSGKTSSKSRRKKRKKRKKQTFSAYEKYVRKVAERQHDATSVYVKRHKRSNRKKKNGWLKDFVKNYSKSLAKLYKL